MVDFSSLLTIAIFSPVALGSLALFVHHFEKLAKSLTFVSSLIPLGIGIILLLNFDSNLSFQFVDTGLQDWLGNMVDVKYKVGLDGNSILLFCFATLLFPITILFSFKYITKSVGLYGFLLLLLETAVLGVFASLDVFLFYLFWEIMIIPVYFLTVIWGDNERKESATMYFIYMLFGSLFMLLGIFFMGYIVGMNSKMLFTTDYEKWLLINIPTDLQLTLFIFFAIAFFFKSPIFPFHVWLPKIYRSAPLAATVGAIVLKMAVYGIIRFNLILFPMSSKVIAPIMVTIGIIGILYGAILAIKKENMFDVIAYSSISHLGFIIVGLFAYTEKSLQGSMIQMIGHGLSTALLLMVIHELRYQSRSNQLQDYGGLKKNHPYMSLVFFIAMLASIGVPGFSGFIGEFLILIGTSESPILSSFLYVTFAGIGVILSAVYMLPMFQKLFLGIESEASKRIKDFSVKQIIITSILVIGIIWIGIAPTFFLNLSEKTSKAIIAKVIKH